MACDTAGDTDLYSINKNHKRSVPPKSENRGKILRLTASEGEVPRDVTSHGPADLERGEVLRVEKDESRELDKELGIIGVKIGEEECNDGSVVPKMISTKNLKILSLNSAGISAAAKKGLANYLYRMDPDIICLQETKLREAPNARDAGGNPNEVPICWRTYPYQYWSCSTDKKGYSGVSIISKIKPNRSIIGIGDSKFDIEGRCVVLEFQDFFLITCYAPNAGIGLKRLEYKQKWSISFEKFLLSLKSEGKGLIIVGDMNVAHTEFDLARPKQNEGNAGFTKEEREDFTHLKKSVGLIDVYRHKYPDNPGYTYFSYRANSRANYVGWRLDYFLVSENLLEKVKDCAVLDAYIDEGKWVSDHVPLTLELVLCDG